MKLNLCSIYVGDDEANWFAPMHIVYLCLQFAGLVGAGQRSAYFVLYRCTWRPRKSRFLIPTKNNRPDCDFFLVYYFILFFLFEKKRE